MKIAFTLSEILITISIIGIVAAITLPTSINNINNQQYDRARQKALSSIGEAGRIVAIQGNMNSYRTAEELVKNDLSKRLNIAKFCGNTPLNCGFSDNINLNGKNLFGATKKTMPTTWITLNEAVTLTQSRDERKSSLYNYSFLLSNGYSINLFYNPNCIKLPMLDDNTNGLDSVCINAIYDMNGKHGPNTMGKDIGWVTIIGNDETAIAVAPAFNYKNDAVEIRETVAPNICSEKGQRLPNVYELISGSANYLVSNFNKQHYWSGNNTKSKYFFNTLWMVRLDTGLVTNPSNTTSNIRCIRK